MMLQFSEASKMKLCKGHVISLVLMVLLLLAHCKVLCCKPPLIVFGDSFTDVGENALAMPFRSAAEYPPYGIDYFHHPAARFSNGRVISDFLSQGLGYGLVDPYLNSIEPNFFHGVNFASSGSTAMNTTVRGNATNSSSLFSLSVQIDQYKIFKTKVLFAQSKHKGSLRNLPSASRLSHAIHFVEIATNDYILTSLETPNFDPLSVVRTTISAMEYGIRELHSTGAKNIIVMNLIPLGCTPALLTFLGNATLNKDGCLSAFTDLVDLHNTHLEKLLNQLRMELSLKGLVLFDANAIYMDAIRNPSKYGITYTLQACCGVGGKYNYTPSIFCGTSVMLNGTMVEVRRCKEPSRYISWDGIHVVESFAKHLADGVLSGQFLTPDFRIANSCEP